MRATELLELIRHKPFEPLRIHLTDGTTYDIGHPDQIIVLTGRVDIGVIPDPATGVAERVDHCSLLHVVRVEKLASTATDGSGNGRASQS
jgi:hypothetical protein